MVKCLQPVVPVCGFNCLSVLLILNRHLYTCYTEKAIEMAD